MSKLTQQITKGLAQDLVQRIDNFLFDCDGVLWHGGHTITGCVEAVQKLKALGKKIYYVTNNSSKTRAQVVEKCRQFGFPAEPDNIMCTSYAAALYLQKMNFTGKVYMVGNPSMATEMDYLGIKYEGLGPDFPPAGQAGTDSILNLQKDWKPDPEIKCVLVGFDPHHSYLKMFKAASYAKNRNNLFLASNEDAFLPLEKQEICVPGTGSIVASIKIPCRREPHIIGKPSTALFDLLQEVHGLKRENSLMVGDNLHTDIGFAVNCGMNSILVLTGVDRLQQVEENKLSWDPSKKNIIPDYYIESFADFGKYIEDL